MSIYGSQTNKHLRISEYPSRIPILQKNPHQSNRLHNNIYSSTSNDVTVK